MEAYGEGVLSYHWSGPDGSLTDIAAKIEGSDDEHLLVLSVTEADVGSYQVEVRNDYGGSVTSTAASLEICKCLIKIRVYEI